MRAFAGVLNDERNDLDRPTIGGGVELEVDRPHPVGRIRGHSASRRRGAGPAITEAGCRPALADRLPVAQRGRDLAAKRTGRVPRDRVAVPPTL
jgi:hypothetical protein